MSAHRITNEDYIAACKRVHGDRYNYEETFYTTSREPVVIKCRIHGAFTTNANSHLSKGTGCPKCMLGVRKTTEDFVKEAKQVHGDRYDYSRVEYVRKQDPVKIICSTHGEFLQRPSDHLYGSNCPSCTKYGYDKKKRANLYVLTCGEYTKVGITNRDVTKRVWQINNNAKRFGINFQIHFSINLDGIVAKTAEYIFKGDIAGKYENIDLKIDGKTETFANLCPDFAVSHILVILGEINESKIDSGN